MSGRSSHVSSWLRRLAPVAVLAWASLLGAAEPRLTASLDRDTTTVGESVIFSLSFEGFTPNGVVALPEIPNLKISFRGESRNITIENGQLSERKVFQYEVTPTLAGEHVIPALQMKVGDRQLATAQLVLKVSQADETSTGAFMELVLPRKEIYVGETVVLQVNLYAQEGRLVQAPQITADGFILGKLSQPQQSRTQRDGKFYNLLTYQATLMPVKTGTLTLGPASMAFNIPRKNSRRRQDFMDPFGIFGGQEWQQIILASAQEEVAVLPLPSQNVPPSFNGAIGQFTLNLEASPTNLAVGDPITLKINVSGRGSFDSVTLPALEEWREFRSYPPTSKITFNDSLGLEGTKTFEQVVIPQNTEVREMPALHWSFFNPEKKQYEVIRQAALPLTVRPATAGAQQPTILANLNDDSAEAPAAQRDIVHIKPRPGTLGVINPPWIQQPWFLAVQGLPLLGWVAITLWQRRRERLANNPRLLRQQQVAEIIRQGRQELRTFAEARQAEKFFATLFRLLQEQLGLLLDQPAAAITESVLEDQLPQRGLPEPTLARLRELFQTCNQARYAPHPSGQQLADLIPAVERVLQDLHEAGATLAPPRSLPARLALWGWLLLPALTAVADPHTDFQEANKLYEQGKYAAAASAYERILSNGGLSPELLFNYGNAHFKNGRIGKAIEAYRRAEALNPRDPDLRANLQFARQSVGARKAPSVWASALRRLTINEWTALVLIPFWGGLGLLICGRLRPGWRRSLRPYVVLSVLLIVMLLMPLGGALYLRYGTREAVVTVPEAVIRYGPLEESQNHFNLMDGREVTVLDTNQNWLRISDGARTGWVKRDQVAQLSP